MGETDSDVRMLEVHAHFIEEWKYRNDTYISLLKYFSVSIAAVIAFPYLSVFSQSASAFDVKVKCLAAAFGLFMSAMGYYILTHESEKMRAAASAARKIMEGSYSRDIKAVYVIGDRPIDIWPFKGVRRRKSSVSIDAFFFFVMVSLSLLSLATALLSS